MPFPNWDVLFEVDPFHRRVRDPGDGRKLLSRRLCSRIDAVFCQDGLSGRRKIEVGLENSGKYQQVSLCLYPGGKSPCHLRRVLYVDVRVEDRHVIEVELVGKGGAD